MLLGGLFAMHGLAGHGTAHHEVREVMTSAVDSGHQHTGGAGTSGPAPAGSTGDDDTQAGAIGLCMAILAGVAVAAWLVLTAFRPGFGTSVGRHWAVLPRRSQRERDPPCLHQLSILRC